MSDTYFTADHHFGHKGILSERMHSPRPFASIEEHDETLIVQWNAVVRPRDTVWHLGDFAYRCSEAYARSVFARLNGTKVLVRGNHDKVSVRLPWAEPVGDVAHVHVRHAVGVGRGVWLSHYAHRVWPRMHRGDLHLYGHSHGSLPVTLASLDVGVDCWNWTPVTLDQILDRLEECAVNNSTHVCVGDDRPPHPRADAEPSGSQCPEDF